MKMKLKMILAFVSVGLLTATLAWPVAVTNTFTADTTAVASEVNANFTTFEAAVDGLEIVKMGLNADVWNLPDTNPATAGETAGTFELTTLDFADAADDFISIRVLVPSSYINTVDPTIRIDWSSSTTTGNACWCVSTATMGDALTTEPSATDTDCEDDLVDGTTLFVNQTTITITGADFVAGAMQAIQIQRDIDGGGCAGDDDLGADADFHMALLTFTVND